MWLSSNFAVISRVIPNLKFDCSLYLHLIPVIKWKLNKIEQNLFRGMYSAGFHWLLFEGSFGYFDITWLLTSLSSKIFFIEWMVLNEGQVCFNSFGLWFYAEWPLIVFFWLLKHQKPPTTFQRTQTSFQLGKA